MNRFQKSGNDKTKLYIFSLRFLNLISKIVQIYKKFRYYKIFFYYFFNIFLSSIYQKSYKLFYERHELPNKRQRIKISRLSLVTSHLSLNYGLYTKGMVSTLSFPTLSETVSSKV